jgi:SAM-dependent methyltransferase
LHHRVQRRFAKILEQTAIAPSRALEVGGRTGPTSLLRFPQLADAERVCVNLEPIKDQDGITAVTANANDLHMFKDQSFDLVMSNAMFEHDPHFWLSLSEMRRVLMPGGLLVIGVPGIAETAADAEQNLPAGATLTYEIHTAVDYYRFTTMAVEQVFFEGYEQVEVGSVLVPPRVIGYGWRPASVGGTRAGRGLARRFADAARVTSDPSGSRRRRAGG